MMWNIRSGSKSAFSLLQRVLTTATVESSSATSIPSRTRTGVRFLSSSSSSLGSSSDVSLVGFIGLGNMGYRMAQNLKLKKENDILIVFDTNMETMEKACNEDGMQGASSLRDVLDCDVIFTMLPGCDAVHATMNELLEYQRSNMTSTTSQTHKVFVDCSTVSPATSRHWHQIWRDEFEYMFLDAPVSGGVKGAADGTLTFMVGGTSAQSGDHTDNDAFARVEHLLNRMGARIVPCGAQPGSGAAVKLCNNLALATQMIGVCEALNLGTALGVDPTVLTSVMNTSTAACWSSKVNNPHPVVAAQMENAKQLPAANDYKGGFGSKLMLKDLGLATSAAQQVGVATPLGALSKELYSLAGAHGLGDKDFGVILQLLKGGTVSDGSSKH